MLLVKVMVKNKNNRGEYYHHPTVLPALTPALKSLQAHHSRKPDSLDGAASCLLKTVASLLKGGDSREH